VKQSSLIPVERIEKAIYLIRGEKVMLDRDLAVLYGISTKVLKQAVRRNIDRFPDDFMFVLNSAEFQDWRSQFVTSKADRVGLRHAPMAFTEHGILMLSSVLNSQRAIQVSQHIPERAGPRRGRAGFPAEHLGCGAIRAGVLDFGFPAHSFSNRGYASSVEAQLRSRPPLPITTYHLRFTHYG